MKLNDGIKKKYDMPEYTVILLSAVDVLTASNEGDNDVEYPEYWDVR